MKLRHTVVASALLATVSLPAQASVSYVFYLPVPAAAPALASSISGAICSGSVGSISFGSAAAFVALCPALGSGFNFAARFTGALSAPAAGSYTFSGWADDGNVFYINNAAARTAWSDQSGGYSFNASLNAGSNPFQIDYYANTFGASFLTFDLPQGVKYDDTPTGVIPLPAPIALLASGLLAFGALARRSR